MLEIIRCSFSVDCLDSFEHVSGVVRHHLNPGGVMSIRIARAAVVSSDGFPYVSVESVKQIAQEQPGIRREHVRIGQIEF